MTIDSVDQEAYGPSIKDVSKRGEGVIKSGRLRTWGRGGGLGKCGRPQNSI